MSYTKLPDPYTYDKEQYMTIDSNTFEERIYYKHDCGGTKYWSRNLVEDFERKECESKINRSSSDD